MSEVMDEFRKETARLKKRGSANNKDRLAAFTAEVDGAGASWASCDPTLMHRLVVTVTDMGGAITYGLSRDRGAHFLTMMLDDKKVTLWFNGDADLGDAVDQVVIKLTLDS